jgi:hypothetical protein
MSDLESAEQAYLRGDVAETRRLARSVLRGAAPLTEKIRAEELLGKLRPDRAAIGLLLACLIFLALVVSRYAGG